MVTKFLSRFRWNGIIDRRDATVLASRLVSLAIGPLTTVAIGLLFTAEMQGVYYSFSSVIAALIFFDSGVGSVIVQLASRESSKSGILEIHLIQNNTSRLSSILRFAIQWYWRLAGVGALVIFFSGYLLFSGRNISSEWLGPWLMLCVVSILSFMQQPFLSFLEGAGALISVYKYRMARSLLQSAALLIGVTTGLGLWAAPLSVAVGVASGLIYLLGYAPHFRALLRNFQGTTLNWRAEVLPFQGRVAISWIAGYFGVSFLTPVLLATQGPTSAGRLGMTIALFTACTQVAASFIQSQAPTLGRLAAEHKWHELDGLFRRKATLSVGFATALITSVCICFALLGATGIGFAQRALEPSTMLLLGVGFIAYHTEGVIAFFMRAQLKEPYYLLELIAAAISVPAAVSLSRTFDAYGIAGTFAAIHVIFILPIAIYILQRNRRLVL